MAVTDVYKTKNYQDIKKLAQLYGVADNRLFVSASERYCQQLDTINDMRESLKETGVMITQKNIKGDEKIDANPLIAQIAKMNDTANKTLSVMLDVVIHMGVKPESTTGTFDVS